MAIGIIKFVRSVEKQDRIIEAMLTRQQLWGREFLAERRRKIGKLRRRTKINYEIKGPLSAD